MKHMLFPHFVLTTLYDTFTSLRESIQINVTNVCKRMTEQHDRKIEII